MPPANPGLGDAIPLGLDGDGSSWGWLASAEAGPGCGLLGAAGGGDGFEEEFFEALASGGGADEEVAAAADFVDDGLDEMGAAGGDGDAGDAGFGVHGEFAAELVDEVDELLIAEGVACDLDVVAEAFAGEGVEGALADDAASAEDGDGVAHEFEFAEDVGVDEDGFAAVAEVEDDIADFFAADGVDAVEGFVEEDEVWVAHEGPCEAEALAHAFTEDGGAVVFPCFEAGGFEDGGGLAFIFAGGETAETAGEAEDLFGGEVGWPCGVFGEVAGAAELGRIADWAVEETAVAGIWADERHEDLDERAFAGAVGAEEAEDDALFDLHGEPVERLDPVGVGFGDVGEVEGE